MDKPFWEESYRDANVTTFGTKPNKAIEDMWKSFDKDWSILDVGCGEGKNPLFLAEKGFKNLDAFDLSQAGIDKLLRLVSEKQLKVHAWVQDLTQYHFNQNYDLIMSHGTLHFVEKEKWREFIEKAKEHTNTGGLNIIHIFTSRIPASPDIAPFAKGLAEEGELEFLYRDWQIIRSTSHIFEDEHPGVPKHLHASNTVVARKRG